MIAQCAALTFLLMVSMVAPIAIEPAHRPQIVEPSRGERMLFETTAYVWTGNRTSTGTWPARGTVAADPKVLAPGTRVYIPGYGPGVVADTGGAIKGNRLDLYVDSRAEALQWGRRIVEVVVIR